MEKGPPDSPLQYDVIVSLSTTAPVSPSSPSQHRCIFPASQVNDLSASIIKPLPVSSAQDRLLVQDETAWLAAERYHSESRRQQVIFCHHFPSAISDIPLLGYSRQHDECERSCTRCANELASPPAALLSVSPPA